jgi:hypothetical protein
VITGKVQVEILLHKTPPLTLSFLKFWAKELFARDVSPEPITSSMED